MVADAGTTVSVDALGKDIFIFLAASVLVVPLSRFLNANSVLGFLILGCAIGPYGLGLFSNSEADLQLGDFGIVFLLFLEGLQLSPERLQKLGNFFRLGLSEFLLTIVTITAANLFLGPRSSRRGGRRAPTAPPPSPCSSCRTWPSRPCS